MAHSMGGLLAQRALLSNASLRGRISQLLLFGTPSAGLEKGSPFQFWKRQVRDMAVDSPFIKTLRRDWTTTIGPTMPFTFVTIAGDHDEFVPQTSSLNPFPMACQNVAYGNHLQIVKPADAEHLGFKSALKALTGGIAGSSPFDTPLVAPWNRGSSSTRSTRIGRTATSFGWVRVFSRILASSAAVRTRGWPPT